jgi:creatinine amidohydrolase
MPDVYCTSPDLAKARPTIAVVGVGAIEQHGSHLPVGTDWTWVAELSRRVAEELGAYWLPAIPFSMSECHGSTAGTVWLKPETLASVIRDIAQSLQAQGIDRIVILNGHGGNFVLEPTIQELNLTYPSLSIIMPPAAFPGGPDPEIFQSARAEVHAGEVETSLLLYLSPEQVKLDDSVDFVPPVGQEFLDYAFISAVSPAGIWGTPSLASAEKGQRAATLSVERIVSYVRATFADLDRVRAGSGAPGLKSSGRDTGTEVRSGATDACSSGTSVRAPTPGLQSRDLVWPPMLDHRNTSREIREARPSLAILPLATIEQHGPHLPLATDLIVVDAIARDVARELPETTYLLPTFPFGTSIAQSGFPGTVWLGTQTLARVVRDVVEGLRVQGVSRVVVIPSPGGPGESPVKLRANAIVKTAVRQLNYDYPGLDAIWVQPLTAARQELRAIFEAAGEDVHAGEVETSLLLHLRPDLVQGSAEDCTPAVGRECLDFVPFVSLCPGGVWGRASLASAEKGARAFAAAVAGTVRYVVETLAQLEQVKPEMRKRGANP